MVHSFGLKGKKNYSVHMPAAIQSIENMCVDKLAGTVLQLVALANGEVRLYKDKVLMSIITSNDVVAAMRFGKYAREENTLILTFKSGGLAIKILSRNSNFNKPGIESGPPPEQDIPLNIPKKTKLYVEQTQREKDHCIDMHRIFQRDLCKLRLNAARAYVKVLTEGQGLMSYTSAASLRLNIEVQGLGPKFVAIVTLTNTGTKHNGDLQLMVKYNSDLYSCDRPLFDLPALVPGPQYRFEIALACIDRNGGAEPIQVCVCLTTSAVPALAAQIQMPFCDPFDD